MAAAAARKQQPHWPLHGLSLGLRAPLPHQQMMSRASGAVPSRVSLLLQGFYPVPRLTTVSRLQPSRRRAQGCQIRIAGQHGSTAIDCVRWQLVRDESCVRQLGALLEVRRGDPRWRVP